MKNTTQQVKSETVKPRATNTQYMAGFESGKQHDDADPLCLENIRKMESALKFRHKLDPIYNYWLGYKDAFITNHQ